MGEGEQEITIEVDRCVVATVDAACVTAFYATAERERGDAYASFLRLLGAVMRLNGLGECNTKEEVKALLGEALLWTLFIHFVHARDDANKALPCKWFKGAEWSNRGPDRGYDEWPDIMRAVRNKTADLAEVFARYGATDAHVRHKTVNVGLVPKVYALVHERALPGLDLRSLCDMYKLSPRECFECAVLKRKDVLDATYKKLQDKKKKRD